MELFSQNIDNFFPCVFLSKTVSVPGACSPCSPIFQICMVIDSEIDIMGETRMREGDIIDDGVNINEMITLSVEAERATTQ